MEKQTITIYDVAREADVSMATVSRVVNGNPNVKPATRKKVLEVIDRLDYRPNAVARGLASKKTTTVGVIIPDVTNVYFSSLARGIDDVASMYKYNIILANSDANEQKELQVLNTLLAKQVDGIIFMGNKITDELRKQIDKTKTPVVLAGSLDDKEEFESVIMKYFNIDSETLQSKTIYDSENLTYEYKPRGFEEVEYPEYPYSEVVGFTENNDGTITLTANVVFPYAGNSKVYAHEVVVRPLENGRVQYVSNRIIPSEDNYRETWHTPRLTLEEWEELYGGE